MISGGEVALPKKSTAMAGATKATNTKDILHSILGRAKNPRDGQRLDPATRISSMSSWKRRSLLRPDGLKDSDSEENSDDRRNKLNKINVPLSLYALITTATAIYHL